MSAGPVYASKPVIFGRIDLTRAAAIYHAECADMMLDVAFAAVMWPSTRGERMAIAAQRINRRAWERERRA